METIREATLNLSMTASNLVAEMKLPIGEGESIQIQLQLSSAVAKSTVQQIHLEVLTRAYKEIKRRLQAAEDAS